jgi:8-oxo-dGTP pyrophosphatase MutT (NUDIX family)
MTLRVPRQVLVYVFRVGGGGDVQFLLLRRTRERGGFWQGVSGAPESGESDAEGAIREVHEETGFDVAASLDAIDFRYDLRREGGPDEELWDRLYGAGVESIPEEVYVAEVPTGVDPVLAPAEHDAFVWCSPALALSRLVFANNRRALEAAREFVDGR